MLQLKRIFSSASDAPLFTSEPATNPGPASVPRLPNANASTSIDRAIYRHLILEFTIRYPVLWPIAVVTCTRAISVICEIRMVTGTLLVVVGVATGAIRDVCRCTPIDGLGIALVAAGIVAIQVSRMVQWLVGQRSVTERVR